MPSGVYNHYKLKGKSRSKVIREKISKGTKGQIPWNKGLTKETSKKVAINGLVIKNAIKKNGGTWQKGLTKKTDKRIVCMAKNISKANKGNLKVSLAATKRTIKRGHCWSEHYYQGYFYSKKNKRAIRYKSGFEYGFYIALEMLDSVIKYEVESFYIRYEYHKDSHYYVPDVLVYLKDGTKQLVEVKMLGEVNTKINQAKFKATKKYCKENNMEFKIWTEEGFLN